MTIRDLDDDSVAVPTRASLVPGPQPPVELGVALWRHGIDLAVTVPCSERPDAPARVPPYSGREIAERFGRALAGAATA